MISQVTTVYKKAGEKLAGLKKSYIAQKLLSVIRQKIIYAILISALAVILLDKVFPLPEVKAFSKAIYASDGKMLSAYLSEDEKWRMKTCLDEVSPELIKAIIEKEDSWFYWHFGVNPFSVVRAAFQNIVNHKRTSGASTITMQTVRMLSPKERTYINKIVEMLRALQLEMHYSKQEILGLYLSLLPYGGNIEGVKSASYIYFNRPPDKLSLSQAILLTIIPNNPNALRPDRKPQNIIKERNRWIKIFSERSTFNKQQLRDALEEPVSAGRFPVRSDAPHFCRYIAKRFVGDEIKTTLSSSIQQTAERLLSNYIERVRSKAIENGAVIIVENKTNSVVGYCGSQGFQDSSSSGQVNGITAFRSPGSALKPALYAMAFDNGQLTPLMRLNDIPTDFSGFEPENFDRKFRGYVTAKNALVNSLNIPAVDVLKSLGVDKFVTLLDKAGFSAVSKNKRALGLSLILGGCDVKLEELVNLYSAFAHMGSMYPLNYINGNNLNKESPVRLFSPGASYITATILSASQRTDFPNEFSSRITDHPQIAWKTGTSFGKRDAWAIGFNPDYTIGVWLGNFNGKGSADLSGAAIAVPLLFELFNSIDYKPKKAWFDKPAGVSEREVCSETGMLPSENCTNIVWDQYIKNISPNMTCDLYKPFYVDEKETIQYCMECLPDSAYSRKYFPYYQAELASWFVKNNVQFKRPPPHNPYCQAKHSGDGPKILSPMENYEYYIEENSSQQVLLHAACDVSVKQLYWYVDGEFYKKCMPEEKVFFTPAKGITKIACMDDMGRKASVMINVKIY